MRKLIISTAGTRTAKVWKQERLTWKELLQRLKTPTRTRETVEEYKSMPKAKRDDLKDVGGFVGGSLAGGRRKAAAVKARDLVTLDLDHLSKGEDIWPIVETALDYAACIYSTHSHTEENPRVRLILPSSRAMTPDEYEAVARAVADMIGIDRCDDTTFEASRLMYWPSCPRDAAYVFKTQDGSFLDPDEILGSYDDWTDVASWPVSSRRTAVNQRRAKVQGNPTEKKGVVGAFCKAHDIPDAIRKFLPDTYKPTDDPMRYTFTGGSTIGGLVLYQDGAFAYSHHASDPIEGKLVNSFDLVRLHLFKDLDMEETEDIPVTKLPSYKEMVAFALKDEEVSYQMVLDRIEGADEEEPEEETDWRKRLAVTAKGTIANTINNAVLILQNDEKLKGKFYFDAFKERPVVSGDLPWQAYSERVSTSWQDSDDAGLRKFLEQSYQIENQSKIRDAIDLAMLHAIRHPVREYLEGLTWDGERRAETLFSDYLGAADTPYTRAVTKAALTGAVARIMRPGCKHDHILVLVGPQGCGKSTTIGKLGKDWYSDSLYTMGGKEAYELLQGYWILELSEMAAAKKSEVEQIKQFISKQSDSYRAAYARRTQDHPRQCAFFGSTNDPDFLRDYTGGRRFWPVEVEQENRAQELTDEYVDQVWAEAVNWFRDGAPWHLSGKMEAEARIVQKEHTEINDKQGIIEAFIERPVPVDWQERSLEERRLYWSESFEGTAECETEPRLTVCAIEVWCECFGGDPKQYTQTQAREINQALKSLDGWEYRNGVQTGAIYGRQRGYMREMGDILE